jgi:hypothetical protein
MKEIYEFRVREKYANLLFNPHEGKKLGWSKAFGDEFVIIRKIELCRGDPRLKRVGELGALIQKQHDDLFFAGWDIRRQYTADDLEKGELFLVNHISTFEPAGEECGTQYNESSACNSCKAGAQQTTPLFLNWTRIPKGKDIARTIAGEVVVSRRVVGLFQSNSIKGIEFHPVRSSPSSSAESKEWFQAVVKSRRVDVAPPTRTGINPFDEDLDGEYRCPFGHVIGLARLSEIWIGRSTYDGSDVTATNQFIGIRRGLLRPEQFLLISPRVQKLIEVEKIKGCRVEVAHLV